MFRNLLISAAVASSFGLNAANITADSAMAPYVFPENASKTVAVPGYLGNSDTMVQLSDDGRRITAIDPRSGKETETLLDLDNTRENRLKSIEGFTVSPDGSKILVWTDSKPVYRRSTTARYWIYERHSRLLRPVDADAAGRQRSPLFSPDGRMLAYVNPADNNIYIHKIDYGTTVAVTKDGKINEIINGVPDWTYEEEFAATCSMTWAPDNFTLCFLKYNESDVPVYNLTMYQGACDPIDKYELYPGEFSYKYPVAGVGNSKVTLHSYDVETRKLKQVAFSDPRIEYIPRIEYAYAPDRLVVTTLNRDQNRMEIYAVNPRSLSVKSLLVEESTTGWIEPATYENLTLLPSSFVVISSRSGFAGLYEYGYSGALQRTIVAADYDVTDYYGYNATDRCHYFQSTKGGAINRVISRVDPRGRVDDISAPSGTSTAWFSPSMAYMMMRFSDADTPPRYTFAATSRPDKPLRVLEENTEVSARYAGMPRRRFFTIPADDRGPSLNGYVVMPAAAVAGSRCPVVMYQYSGPGSQEVLNAWHVDWENYFAMQGYIVVCVDGRGTGGRGREFREAVYRNLGHYETIDQLRAARYAASLPEADPARIGIHGWSYGGYETLMAASAEGSPYKAAVAVAPVTDWRYYDTVYAERYMLTPQQNASGYEASAPLNAIDNMNTRLLIMHGTADDNVHPANTMEYVARLIAAGKFCDMLMFPNQNHSIRGCNTRLMVYSRMLDYFNHNL